jgi:hypothetical protein
MAGPQMPAGQPVEERRRHKAERDARFKSAVAEAMDFGKPRPHLHDPVFDAGAELATKRVTAAVELGRPLRPSERRQVRREVLAEQAGAQPAGQSQRRRPTIDEYLESLSERQRDEIEQTDWFRGLDERHRADVRRRVDALAQVEEEAEYEFQIWKEQRSLANIADADDDVDWAAAASEETIAAAAETAWSDGLTAAEQRAAEDIAAATAGPLYTGDPEEVYSDDLEDGWGIDEEGDDE